MEHFLVLDLRGKTQPLDFEVFPVAFQNFQCSHLKDTKAFSQTKLLLMVEF